MREDMLCAGEEGKDSCSGNQVWNKSFSYCGHQFMIKLGVEQVTVAVRLSVPLVRETLQCWLGSLLGARDVAGTEDA